MLSFTQSSNVIRAKGTTSNWIWKSGAIERQKVWIWNIKRSKTKVKEICNRTHEKKNCKPFFYWIQIECEWTCELWTTRWLPFRTEEWLYLILFYGKMNLIYLQQQQKKRRKIYRERKKMERTSTSIYFRLKAKSRKRAKKLILKRDENEKLFGNLFAMFWFDHSNWTIHITMDCRMVFC